MLVRTPDGIIDVRAIQLRAADQLKSGVVTDDIKAAVGLLGTMVDEMDELQKRLDEMSATLIH